MKFSKNILLLIFFLSTRSVLFAQTHPDDIVGYYLVTDPFSEAISQVHIYNAGNGSYEAILIWVEDKEGKEYEGLVFLKEMTFNAKDKEWQNAVITYPGKSGKFKAAMRLEKDGRLRIRAYWGVAALGKTLHWKPEKESRNPKIQPPVRKNPT